MHCSTECLTRNQRPKNFATHGKCKRQETSLRNAIKVAQTEVYTNGHKLSQVESYSPVTKVTDTIAILEAETLGYTRPNGRPKP